MTINTGDSVTIKSDRINEGVSFKAIITKVYNNSMNLTYPLVGYKTTNGKGVCCSSCVIEVEELNNIIYGAEGHQRPY